MKKKILRSFIIFFSPSSEIKVFTVSACWFKRPFHYMGKNAGSLHKYVKRQSIKFPPEQTPSASLSTRDGSTKDGPASKFLRLSGRQMSAYTSESHLGLCVRVFPRASVWVCARVRRLLLLPEIAHWTHESRGIHAPLASCGLCWPGRGQSVIRLLIFQSAAHLATGYTQAHRNSQSNSFAPENEVFSSWTSQALMSLMDRQYVVCVYSTNRYTQLLRSVASGGLYKEWKHYSCITGTVPDYVCGWFQGLHCPCDPLFEL